MEEDLTRSRTHSFFIRQDDSKTIPVHTIQVMGRAVFVNKRVFKSYFRWNVPVRGLGRHSRNQGLYVKTIWHFNLPEWTELSGWSAYWIHSNIFLMTVILNVWHLFFLIIYFRGGGERERAGRRTSLLLHLLTHSWVDSLCAWTWIEPSTSAHGTTLWPPELPSQASHLFLKLNF